MSLTPLIRLLLIGCSLSAMLQAAEPPLARSSAGFDDAKLALKVKSAIAADPEIGGINVFVSVLDGVVAVQGPVESAAVKEKLQKLVSTVPGVATVKVDCFVLAAEDTLKKEVAKRLAPVPSGETSSAAAAAAAATPEPKISVPQGTGSLPSIAVGPPTLTANVPTTSDDLPPLNGSKSTVTVQRASDSIEPMRPLLPGELLAAPVSAKPTATASKSSTDIPAAKSSPTIPPPNVPIVPVGMQGRSADELAFSLIELRKSNPRFAGINATIESGVVSISGRADSEAVEAFLTAVRQMPGVLRVEVR